MNQQHRRGRPWGGSWQRDAAAITATRRILVSAVFALLLTAHRSPAALNAYLDLTGIPGESTDTGYKDKIDLLSWSWGLGQPGSFHTGATTPTAQATFSDLFVTKWVDKSSPALMLRCADGSSISKGTLTITETIASQIQPVVTIDLDSLNVTSLSVGGSTTGDHLAEQVSLKFSKFKKRVHLFDAQSSSSGSSSVEWDLTTNTGSATSGGSNSNSFPTDPPPVDPPPVNTAPTITAITAQTITEDTSATLTFTVADAETVAGALVVSRGTSNPTLIPVSGINVTGSGGSKTATVTPAKNATGSATLTFAVRDGGGLTSSTTVTITVTPVNDPPDILVNSVAGGPPLQDPSTPGSLISIDGEPVIFEILLVDPDHPAEQLLTSASSSNQEILPDPAIEILGDGPIRTVQIIPQGAIHGTTTVSITAMEPEGASSTPMVFEVTTITNPSPDAQIVINGFPSLQPFPVSENTPPLGEIGIVEVLTDPPLPFTFNLLDSSDGRFALTGPENNILTLGEAASLDFETSFPPSIVIQALDPQGSTSTARFMIDIININEPASLDPPHQGNTTPGTPTRLTGIVITDPDITPGAEILLTAATSNGILTIDESGPLAGRVDPNNAPTINVSAPVETLNSVLASGGLTFTSAPGFTGTASLTFNTNDNGSSGEGGPQFYAAETFIEVALPPLEQWFLDRFTAAQLADPAVGGLFGHGDTDALDNLIEYGTGTDPTDPDNGFEVFEIIDVFEDGETYPAVRFPRRYSDPSLIVTVEQATDTNNWSAGPGFTETVYAIRVDDEIELATVRSSIPKNASRRQQLRVRFQAIEP